MKIAPLMFIATMCIAVAASAPAQPAPEPARPASDSPPSPIEQVPAGVRVLRDLAYVERGHAQQKLDLFLPEKKPDAPLPVIVVVHGGGWGGGDKTKWYMPTLNLIARGYAVASVNYRLTGVAPHPAQLEDCKSAIRWLRAHAADYDLDARHFGAWGASAGGHLVALLGTTGGTREYDVGAHLDQSSAVQAVCDCYGPVDLARIIEKAGAERAPKAILQLLGGAGPDLLDAAKRASPFFQVGTDTPPFLIMQGDKDPLVAPEQSERFYEALRAAGVPVRLHLFRGAPHGGFTPQLVEEMAAEFFGRTLQTRPVPAGAPATARTESEVAPRPKVTKP